MVFDIIITIKKKIYLYFNFKWISDYQGGVVIWITDIQDNNNNNNNNNISINQTVTTTNSVSQIGRSKPTIEEVYPPFQWGARSQDNQLINKILTTRWTTLQTTYNNSPELVLSIIENSLGNFNNQDSRKLVSQGFRGIAVLIKGRIMSKKGEEMSSLDIKIGDRI